MPTANHDPEYVLMNVPAAALVGALPLVVVPDGLPGVVAVPLPDIIVAEVVGAVPMPVVIAVVVDSSVMVAEDGAVDVTEALEVADVDELLSSPSFGTS